MCDTTCSPYEGCACAMNRRRYFTKNEQIENLKQYKTNLEQEIKAVDERIRELSK